MIRKIEKEALTAQNVVLTGIQFDEYSSFMRGPAEAPELIRDALYSDSSNMYSESRKDISKNDRLVDVGNLVINEYFDIEKGIDELLNKGVKTVSLGGDHSVTYPIIKAYLKKYPNLNILHFDSHPDLYDEQDGNPHMHGCPFARIKEAGMTGKLIQVGIRTLNDHQAEQAERYGNIEMIEMKDWKPGIQFSFDGPVYVSIDMDVLDPAFVPGVSHHEPGGFSTRELITMIQGLDLDIVGADVVEYNPTRDINYVTAMTTAKVVKEMISKILEK